MYNLLEGKAKEKFHEYLSNHKDKKIYKLYYDEFAEFNPSMQWGVVVDFFEENKIFISDRYNEVCKNYYYMISTDPIRDDVFAHSIETRHEARESAIKEAVKIFNEEEIKS